MGYKQYILVMKIDSLESNDELKYYILKTINDFGLPITIDSTYNTIINLSLISNIIDINNFDKELYLLIYDIFNDDYDDLTLVAIEVLVNKLVRIKFRR